MVKINTTQTEQKLKNENIKFESKAYETHCEVVKEIRNTIEKLGGTMPENLPTPNKKHLAKPLLFFQDEA